VGSTVASATPAERKIESFSGTSVGFAVSDMARIPLVIAARCLIVTYAAAHHRTTPPIRGKISPDMTRPSQPRLPHSV
jgi:hypothetical protein